MRVFLFFISAIILLQTVQSQKLVKKVIASPDTQHIQIDTKNCYQVNLKTSSSRELLVKASIEGEYLKDLVVKIEEKGKNVMVSTGFLPNFISPNDKLSAHKVISISLDIEIPEYSNVQSFGTNSSITAEGKYKSLQVTLSDGNCILKNVIEKAEVRTQKGNITIFAKKGNIDAKSIYGKVDKHDIPRGHPSYLLNSVEGDIQISKTE